MTLFRCNGFRSVRALGIRDAAEIFARRAARRAFGKRGIVRVLNEDSYTRNLFHRGVRRFHRISDGPQ